MIIIQISIGIVLAVFILIYWAPILFLCAFGAVFALIGLVLYFAIANIKAVIPVLVTFGALAGLFGLGVYLYELLEKLSKSFRFNIGAVKSKVYTSLPGRVTAEREDKLIPNSLVSEVQGAKVESQKTQAISFCKDEFNPGSKPKKTVSVPLDTFKEIDFTIVENTLLEALLIGISKAQVSYRKLHLKRFKQAPQNVTVELRDMKSNVFKLKSNKNEVIVRLSIGRSEELKYSNIAVLPGAIEVFCDDFVYSVKFQAVRNGECMEITRYKVVILKGDEWTRFLFEVSPSKLKSVI